MTSLFSKHGAWTIVLAAAACAGSPARASAQTTEAATAESLTTLAKVYTAEQAAKGRESYMASCVGCHKPVELAGERFGSGLVGKTVADFFAYLRSSMPQDNPASLSDDDYANVTAYILQLNTMPAGERLLPSDTVELAKIRVVPPDTTRKGPGK